jgi:hypothetical protein
MPNLDWPRLHSDGCCQLRAPLKPSTRPADSSRRMSRAITTLFRMSTRVGWAVGWLAVASASISILAWGLPDVEETEFHLCLAVVTFYGTAMAGLLGAGYRLIDHRRVPVPAVVLLLLAAVPSFAWLCGVFGLFGIAKDTVRGHHVVELIDRLAFNCSLASVVILAIVVPVLALLRESTRRAFYDARRLGPGVG